MTDSKFENTLAYYCSPVLMNQKISNLVSISKSEFPQLEMIIDSYNARFSKYDLKIETICQCGKRMLVFVYKKNRLQEYLSRNDVKQILTLYGYDSKMTFDNLINRLKARMAHGDFPHEIGIFLGYPLGDVIGFIENSGQNYRISGYWKVYQDEHKAEKLFRLYDNLRKFMLRRISCGDSLENILDRYKSVKNIA